nr:hypothetical protein [bacterium]
MKFMFAAIILLATAVPAFGACWLHAGSDDVSELSGDPCTLKISDGLASMWFKVDYKVMQTTEVNGVSIRFNEEKVRYVANCATGTGLLTTLVRYNTKTNKLVDSIDNTSTKLAEPVPESRLDNLYKLVCAAKRGAS